MPASFSRFHVVSCCGGIVLLLGIVALAVWALKPTHPWPALTVAPGAVGLLLCLGVTLLASSFTLRGFGRGFTKASALLGGGASGWILVETYWPALPRSDQWLAGHAQALNSSHLVPPQTSLSLLMLFLAVGLQGHRSPWAVGLSRVCIKAVAAICWLAIFGHAVNVNPFESLVHTGDLWMSPLTIVALLIGTLGLETRRHDEGIFNLLTSRGEAGAFTRVLLPFALLVPLVLTWLVFYRRDLDVESAFLAVSCVMAVVSLLLAILIVRVGKVMKLHEAERRKAEKEREMADRFREATMMELQEKAANMIELQDEFVKICAWTKRIMDHGEWIEFEEFLSRRLKLRFTHGISDEAFQRQMEKVGAARPAAPPAPGEPGPDAQPSSHSTPAPCESIVAADVTSQ